MTRLIIALAFFLTLSVYTLAQQGERPAPQPAADTFENFKVGMAGFTFVRFDLDKTLETMQRCDVQYLCIKDFHLPFNSSDSEIAEFHAKLAAHNVTGYAVGPIYMRTTGAVDTAFAYAKRVGVKLIVGVPNYELLPYINQKVQEYDMHYAIHNHGPDIALYPDAEDIWNNVHHLDPRMGICLDIGHNLRYDKCPVEALEKYHTRVFDIHIKDVTANRREGYSVEIGRGIIDYPAFVRMLRQVGYSGVCSLEHERNMDNPFLGIAESIGYFRAMLTATR